MRCENEWSVRVHDSNELIFEARPFELDLSISRNEYDFCSVEFPWKVGEMMKPHTKFETGKLYNLLRGDVLYNGEVIHPFLFKPDWVTYTKDKTQVDLHDLHKALDYGEVDIYVESATVQDIYEQVINSARNRIIDTVDFSISNEFLERDFTSFFDEEIENVDGYNINNYISAIDFEEETPEIALRKLNEEFGFQSWINSDGVLMIGIPETNSRNHIAAPDDKAKDDSDKVWNYKNAQISHTRNPIRRVIVYGNWVDAAGLETDPRDWFNGNGDVRAVGVAERTDVEEGDTISVETKAKKGMLGEIAQLHLIEETKRQHSGSVELDPHTSGTFQSYIENVRPGDSLRLVPHDKLFKNPTATSGEIGDEPDFPSRMCGSMTRNESYDVSQVNHTITNEGAWEVDLELMMQVEFGINNQLTYIDPTTTGFEYSNPSEDDFVDAELVEEPYELTGAGPFGLVSSIGWEQVQSGDDDPLD
jgi:hypothetical protein